MNEIKKDSGVPLGEMYDFSTPPAAPNGAEVEHEYYHPVSLKDPGLTQEERKDLLRLTDAKTFDELFNMVYGAHSTQAEVFRAINNDPRLFLAVSIIMRVHEISAPIQPPEPDSDLSMLTFARFGEIVETFSNGMWSIPQVRRFHGGQIVTLLDIMEQRAKLKRT